MYSSRCASFVLKVKHEFLMWNWWYQCGAMSLKKCCWNKKTLSSMLSVRLRILLWEFLFQVWTYLFMRATVFMASSLIVFWMSAQLMSNSSWHKTSIIRLCSESVNVSSESNELRECFCILFYNWSFIIYFTIGMSIKKNRKRFLKLLPWNRLKEVQW